MLIYFLFGVIDIHSRFARAVMVVRAGGVIAMDPDERIALVMFS